ncbi:hypothetical protein [Ktedonospora formicarum]|uniref:Uncharacterized protein n=1 Tax=Ktedonospora formicarum TaxID=2778364 RepID=A0A8J3I829_9CHLR|nr:hypothetical protein [Ktedonospora formicarum]GHO48893.1 hypothetical protein KSX_70560 [Ktedonospora formicarum]
MAVQVKFLNGETKRFDVAPNGQLSLNNHQVLITEKEQEVNLTFGDFKGAITPARRIREYKMGRQQLTAVALGGKTYINWMPPLLFLREEGDLFRCPRGGDLQPGKIPPLRDGILQIIPPELLGNAQRQGRGDLFAPFLQSGAAFSPLRGTAAKPFLVRRLLGSQGQLVRP